MNVELWTKIPSDLIIDKTVKALEKHGFIVFVVDTKEEALEKMKELIPDGVSVMTGSSTTLKEIGFMDYYLSGEHQWHALGPEVFNEQDSEQKAYLRRMSDIADYFTASVNAISQTGELIAVDMSGSRVGAYPFTAKKLLLVAGVQKIVPTLNDAMKRIREYVLIRESERMQAVNGISSALGKWVILEHEFSPERTTLILVKEALGF